MSEAKPVTSPADYADAIVQALREPLIVIDADLGIRAASRSFYETFKVAPEQTIGPRLYEIGNRQWDIPDFGSCSMRFYRHESNSTIFKSIATLRASAAVRCCSMPDGFNTATRMRN